MLACASIGSVAAAAPKGQPSDRCAGFAFALKSLQVDTQCCSTNAIASSLVAFFFEETTRRPIG